MSQLTKKVTPFDRNKSYDIFDIESILNSLPFGVALFDEKLNLIDYNNVFFSQILTLHNRISEELNLSDIFNFPLYNKALEKENLKAINLIIEMFHESSASDNFNWIYKFNLDEYKTAECKVEFFTNKGVVLTILEDTNSEKNQLIEFQAAKEYLESQTREAIHMAEDLAIAKEEAANTAQRIQIILNAMEEGLVTLNSKGQIIAANKAMSIIFGYAPSEFIGMELKSLLKSQCAKSSEDFTTFLNKKVDDLNVYKSDEKGNRKDGSSVPLRIDIREVFLEQEKHYTVLLRNVSEQYEAEKIIRHMAWHDSLTGLANRNLLSARLEDALKIAKRLNKKVAVMILDLDKFKPVNDLYGHAIGDELLKVVAERLLYCAREVDTVARLGGDEFAIVLSNIENDKNIITIADRIIYSIQQPTEIDGNVIQIGTSIGVSFYPDDSDSPVELIRMADVALYQAKEDGRRLYRLYDRQMDAETKAQKQLEIDLNKALENNELLLQYQPQFDAKNNKLVGAEALIRWEHPEKGMIPPYSFIPVAELCGLMIPIGQWVLNTACKAAKTWQDQGLPKIRISVNISARQFHADNFVKTIEDAINYSGLKPCWLELEITEGMVIKNTDNVVMKLEQLKALGVNLSIDDFGTGYSSLAYLKRFPVDQLKIDQSFIRNIHEDPDDAAITDAVIRLGHSLGLNVVGEGVETEKHVEILKAKGCDILQGYYFCRPINQDEFVSFLKNHQH
ncbi:MAG: EAL domain-containing protein [Kordiimonadaceae bacterium]|nr:EAL domain-containing protein [Kordiimonadaceae bacterium]